MRLGGDDFQAQRLRLTYQRITAATKTQNSHAHAALYLHCSQIEHEALGPADLQAANDVNNEWASGALSNIWRGCTAVDGRWCYTLHHEPSTGSADAEAGMGGNVNFRATWLLT